MIKLSILIPTIKRHAAYLNRLQSELNWQMIPFEGQVEILIDDHETDSIGTKRNRLLGRAAGKYLCFFDSDDTPSPKYISLLMQAVESDCDCASLKGMYSSDCKEVGIFEHSIKYKKWETVNGEIKFLRYPNHLNLLRSSIAKRFKFPETSFGEDHIWSTAVHKSGLLKTEHYIPEIIYHYNYISHKMKYSQNDEQSFIEDYFSNNPNGKFIDIGAYDVFRFSNVRKMYEIGWGGICVEPAPSNYKAIADHYKDEPRIKVLNVAIGEETGVIDFYESNGDAVGTTDVSHMEKWGAAGVKYTKIQVPQVNVVDFMSEHCNGVDLLSIDTESTNIIIFRKIPDWVWLQIKMLVIEHDNNQDEIERKLIPFGFVPLYTNAENILLAKL